MTNEAYVMINCDIGKESAVVERLRNLSKDVKEARACLGIYDIFVKIRSPTEEELLAIIAMIRKVGYIRSTITLMPIKALGGSSEQDGSEHCSECGKRIIVQSEDERV